MNDWISIQNGACTIFAFDNIAAGWEQWVLLVSDQHHDNRFCNRELEMEHLETAKRREALIISAGDTFDAMQGRYDKRKSYDEIRQEDVTENYYDSIVIHATEDYAPFAANFGLIGRGNHETAVERNAGISLTSNLVHRLNTEHGGRVKVGGYGGWALLRFRIHGTVIQTINLKYNHGAGGASPVTRGVIDTARQAVYLPDADIVLNGHNHQSYLVPIPRERVTQKGDVYTDVSWYIRTPGYKNDWRGGAGGYGVEKGMAPTANGACWLHLRLDGHGSRVVFEPILDIRGAK